MSVSQFIEFNSQKYEVFSKNSQAIMELLITQYIVLKLSQGASSEEVLRLIKSREVDFNEIDIKYSLTIASSFSDPIKEAISDENYEVVSVLSGTQIEHIMNMFLTDVLETKYSFSDNDISQILNAINLPAKLSWFLTITTDNEINDSLREKLLRIVSLRNRIAHFKSLSYNKKLFSEEDIGLLSNSTVLITELEQELSNIWLKAFPLYKEAYEIVRKFSETLSD